MFKEGITGTLMDVKKSDRTRLGFLVWFPFVRKHMDKIREGSLIAVRNFSSDTSYDHYSILRITSVMPKHYALMASRDGYPGFVEEAAHSASHDWDQQSPTEDTTKIECDAVPSSFELKINRIKHDMNPEIFPEENMPMPGERVKVLNDDYASRVINLDIQNKDDTITVGKLANLSGVDILALRYDMIRTHFGVFAYTNAGKSNLISTVSSKMLAVGGIKMVIYDLMGEYSALLIDTLYRLDRACIVCLSPKAVPESVHKFWRSTDQHNLESAAKDLVRTTIVPKAISGQKARMVPPMQKILRDGKIKLLSYQNVTIQEMIGGILDSAKSSIAADDLADKIRRITHDKIFNAKTIQETIDELERHKMLGSNLQYAKELKRNLLAVLRPTLDSAKSTEIIDDKFKIRVNDIISDLNGSGTSLYLIQDSDDHMVRKFSSKLGMEMLDHRRRGGILSPPVSFVYDEADQFIAQDDKQEGMKDSKRAAEQLARRGRKYGLGIGIATQRIVYLDTNILGQPHTYFVSRLPRASDREKIQEAFGLSDETLQETLRFGTGRWLMISHSATGIDGLPVPVQVEDANIRIIKFLDRPDQR